MLKWIFPLVAISLSAHAYLSPIGAGSLVSGGSGAGTDNCVARWNGTGVYVLQDSVVCITDTGGMSGIESLTIGGAIDASSIFDVTSTTDGSRPCPRMTTVQRDLVAAPAQGLCIYNTTANEYQSYDTAAAAWESMGGIAAITAASDSAIVLWDGTGGDTVKNSVVTISATGSVSGVSNLTYTGTLTTPLGAGRVAYVGNSGEITATTGLTFIATASQLTVGGSLQMDGTAMYAGDRDSGAGLYNTYLGLEAGLNQGIMASANTGVGYQANRAITTGTNNTAVGQMANLSTTFGVGNTAIGTNALRTNVSGQGNTAIGRDALRSTGSVNFNTALGHGALFTNTTGANNTAVGRYALFSNSTGSNNVAEGYESGYNALGSGNVFLGYQAGYSETGSNLLYLDNSNTIYPLLKGDFASDTLIVHGRLEATSTLLASNPCPDMTTAQKNAIAAPTVGDCVYDIDLLKPQSYNGSSWTSMGGVDGLSSFRPLISSNGNVVELGSMTDGQLIIGSTGATPVIANLLGTTNQVSVANASGSITLSLPQSIDTGASFTVATANITGLLASSPVKTDASKNLTSGLIDLAALTDITGILDEANGGTGQASYATGDLLYASNASTLVRLPIGASGDYVRNVGGVPTWGEVVASGGDGGVTSVGTIDSVAKSADGAAISGTTIYMQTADTTSPGLMSISTQSLSGLKTFANGIVDSTLTSGRVALVGTSGRMFDDSGITYSAASDSILLGGVKVSSTTMASTVCNPVLSASRNLIGLGLGTADKGACVYDTEVLAQFNWNGASWIQQSASTDSQYWAGTFAGADVELGTTADAGEWKQVSSTGLTTLVVEKSSGGISCTGISGGKVGVTCTGVTPGNKKVCLGGLRSTSGTTIDQSFRFASCSGTDVCSTTTSDLTTVWTDTSTLASNRSGPNYTCRTVEFPSSGTKAINLQEMTDTASVVTTNSMLASSVNRVIYMSIEDAAPSGGGLNDATYSLGYSEVRGSTAADGNIPGDSTIPQVGEGTEILTVTATPKRIGAKIHISVNVRAIEETNQINNITLALFKDGAANAVAADTMGTNEATTNLNEGRLIINYQETVTSLTPIVYTVRIGGDGAASDIVLNESGNAGTDSTAGGVISSWIKVTEEKY